MLGVHTQPVQVAVNDLIRESKDRFFSGGKMRGAGNPPNEESS